METKLKVDIQKRGSYNENILTIVAAHNGREVATSLLDLISYATTQRALYPKSSKGFEIFKGEDEDKVYVTEDGGLTFTMIIEEITLLTLKEEAEDSADDIKNIL